jgi:ribosomal protein L13E
MSEKAPKKKVQAKKAAPKKKAKPKKTKAKAEKVEEKEEAKAVVQKVNLGPAPRPVVNSRHGFSMREREARGYSFGELVSAGIPVLEVKRLNIPIDIRRRTALEHNVEMLKGWYKEPERKPARESSGEKPGSKAGSKRGKKPAEQKEE